MYRHIRLDKNEPFYIGIGTVQIIKGKYYYYQRAKERSNRNNLWYKIVNKTEYNIEILYETNDFDIICDKEKEFIKLYGRIDLGTGTLCNLTISEGKFHQVKEMLKAVDNKVIYLKRIKFGNLELNDLKIGEVIEINKENINIK